MNSGSFLPLESHRGAKIENKTVYVSKKRDLSVAKQRVPIASEYEENIGGTFYSKITEDSNNNVPEKPIFIQNSQSNVMKLIYNR